MEPGIATILRELEARSARETAARRTESPAERAKSQDGALLAVGPEVGSLMNMLIIEAEAKAILEIGTSYGYSTLWLAEAASQTGGKVVSLDMHAYKQEQAKSHLARAGLEEWATFITGDARETIPRATGNFDFVLIDAWKDTYIPCFELVAPRLNPGAIVIADNMNAPAEAREPARAYREHVRTRKDFESVLLPLQSGVYVSRYAVR